MVRVYSVNDPETGVERFISFDVQKQRFSLGGLKHIAYDPANPEDMASLVSCFSRTHSGREFLSANQLSVLGAALLDLVARPPKEMKVSASS